jgi:carbamoyl-phosphate synthase large subunit
VIGSGPIVIGQACEFDYSGTQAVKALRSEGLEVVLVNSNPATIMTDPELADRTYVEPLTADALEKIIAREKPDAILPTVGGQTALNLAVQLDEMGVLKRHKVELIGAQIPAIKVAEDRLLFRDAMKEIGVSVPESGVARTLDDALQIVARTGFPAIIRPSFTMGGVGGGIAYNLEEFKEIAGRGLHLSPVREVLVEESVIGWKEFELEVMRDGADNFVVICSIENIDPMGVHTGDSVTVAPALTLTDKEYQRMRDAAGRIIRRVGVETGGSNIQFAINPDDGRMVAIEMNPRVSRSSALASKATGFPIAKIAAKLALGYRLDEIPNDITRVTPASFEPTIDYIVVKIPRWNFEKFPQADRTLTTQMKSVGEAMAIGRTFKEAFLKGIRSLELGKEGLLFRRPALGDTDGDEGANEDEDVELRRKLVIPTDRRLWALFRAIDKGWDVAKLHELTNIDPWFLQQFTEMVELRKTAEMVGLRHMSYDLMRTLKRSGFGDRELADILGVDEAAVREKRQELKVAPAFKRILRRGIRVVHALHVFELRRHLRSRSDRQAEGDHPWQRAESYRPGHRVRLLLLSRGVRIQERGVRDHHGQLQPRDGVDRLRHVGSLVLRAAHARRRDGDCRTRAPGQRRRVVRGAVWRPDAAQAGAGPAGSRRHDSRHDAGLDRSRRRSPAVFQAVVGSRNPAACQRHGDVARRSKGSGGQGRVPGRGASLIRARRPGDGNRL